MSERMPRGGGETLHDRLATMSGEELQDSYDKALDDPQVWNEVMRRMGVNPETVDEDKFSDEQRRKAIETAAEVIREKRGGAPARPSGSESGVPTRGTDSGRPDYGRPFGERDPGGSDKPKKRGLRALIIGLSLAAAAGVTGVAWAANRGVSEPDSVSGSLKPGGNTEGGTQDGTTEATKDTTQEVVQSGSSEAEKGHETAIIGNYDYYNANNKETDVAWMNAGDFITDLINNDKIKVITNEEGKLVFENPSEANKTILKEAFKLNNEQAATFIAYARDAGLFGDYVPENVTIEEAEEFLEGASSEEIDAIVKEWEDEIDQATFEEVKQTGKMNNEFIQNVGGGDIILDSSQAEVVYCETDETGHIWTKTNFANGGSIQNKFNLSQFEMEDETYSAENDDGTISGSYECDYIPCIQGGSVTEIVKHPPHKKITPPPHKKITPPPKEKKDPGRTGMSTGLDGSYVDKRGQNSELGTKPDETKEVDWDNGGNDGSEGKQKYDKAPDSNTQKGAQDTSEKSQDGTGRSVDQVLADQEQDGAVKGEKKDNKKTAEDESRTQADQKKQDGYDQLQKNAEKAGNEYKELEKTGDEREKQSQEEIGDSLDWLN